MTPYGIGPVELFLMFALVVVPTWVFYRILARCTGHGWLGILWLVPVVNVLVLLYAAFGPYPPERTSTEVQ